MNPKDITVIFQGATKPYTAEDGLIFYDTLKKLKKILPGCKVILSTWEGSIIPDSWELDEIIFNKDPGSFIGIHRVDPAHQNNINRQIVSTYNALLKTKTKYAVKMRSDAELTHAGFLDYFKKFGSDSTIVTCSLFTIDGTTYHHMPFHTSDWFQFGTTQRLLEYWGCEHLTKEDAEWYLSHDYAKGSTYWDRELLPRLVVEQYLTVSYANKLGYVVPQYHNDARIEVMESYREFLAREVVVLDPWQIGFNFPKYHRDYHSMFASMNCIMFADWYYNYINLTKPKFVDKGYYLAGVARNKKKNLLRFMMKLVKPIEDYWYPSKFRKLITKFVLKFKLF